MSWSVLGWNGFQPIRQRIVDRLERTADGPWSPVVVALKPPAESGGILRVA